MPVSKKQQACVDRYNKANYEEIKIRVKKGEKAILQEVAAVKGMSLNAYVLAAIQKYQESIEK